MNARQYRTEYNLSPLDFPAIEGPGESRIDFRTEPPFIVNNKVKLKITKKYVLVEFYNGKEHEILTAMSIYEIPINEIKSREHIYECYKDATLGLNEAYKYVKAKLPLPDIIFPTMPIETYKKEIDGVFYLLNTLN
ncbi:hypothetical protein SAMN05443549_11512 [Flavobacterium fluvii]|uniref:Uncharacterized protein n=1 Tax=Flavobacterium fluvii TaxID=468056 RepID=A0A1M5PZG2_9FLAO|nr:hypothetical protein [Flavobacterium fluvii]SHH07128.1 hypothetical protein SAMN05443549_11512 [Flavobacterium fluvii]